jgi:predicted small lipoprotein YifL
MRALLLLLLLAVGIGACGKKGPPEPAGPKEKITYPHAYPSK